MKILTAREKIILYITVLVLAFSAAFSPVIIPLVNKDRILSQGITVTRLKFKKYLWLLSQKENIQDKYKEFSKTFKAPGQKEDIVVLALTQLENLAKESGIQIVDIRPQLSKNSSSHKEILVDLRTEGQIAGYFKFIYGIENPLSLFRIKKLQISTKINSQAIEGNFSISQLSILD